MKKLFSFFVLSLFAIGSFAADYYVAGNGTAGNPWCNGISWNPAAAVNKLVDGTITYNDVPAGVYEFKITNGSWSQSWGASAIDAACSDPGYEGNDNVKLTTALTQDITISFDGTKICVKGQFGGKVEINSYTIVGASAVLGTNWDANNAANDMAKQESGVWTLTKKEISLLAGDYEYKVVGNHSYSVYEYPSGEGGNSKLSITKPGIYDVVFTFNPATPELSAEATFIREDGDLPAPVYYLTGWINNADYTGDDYKFVDGKLTARFDADSYVGVRNGATTYLTEAYVDFATSATATLKAGNKEKMGVYGGKDVEFTLVVNQDGTLTLSYQIDDTPSAVENVVAGYALTLDNGCLSVATDKAASVALYTIGGQLLDMQFTSDYRCTLNAGIYILRVNNTAEKLVVF